MFCAPLTSFSPLHLIATVSSFVLQQVTWLLSFFPLLKVSFCPLLKASAFIIFLFSLSAHTSLPIHLQYSFLIFALSSIYCVLSCHSSFLYLTSLLFSLSMSLYILLLVPFFFFPVLHPILAQNVLLDTVLC